MAFDLDLPTLSQVVSRASSDIDAELGTEFALLQKSVERVFATVSAGLAFGVYGKQEAISRNIVPGRENDEAILEQWALLWLGNEDGRKEARAARFDIEVTAGAVPVTVPSGTTWRREDGAIFGTTEEIEMTESPQSLSVLSQAADESEPGWGAGGNTTPGSTLTLVSAIALDPSATVEGDPSDPPVGSGTDEESLEDLADRVVFRAQNPPRGGAAGDWIAWAREVPGVAQAWEQVDTSGLGTVTVYIVRDDFDSPLPDAALIDEVDEHIQTQKPITITHFVQAPSLRPITVLAQIIPFTTEVQDAITESIRDMFARRAVPGQPDDNNRFRVSWINEAISLADGEIDHTLLSPGADVEVSLTELARPGDILFEEKMT